MASLPTAAELLQTCLGFLMDADIASFLAAAREVRLMEVIPQDGRVTIRSPPQRRNEGQIARAHGCLTGLFGTMTVKQVVAYRAGLPRKVCYNAPHTMSYDKLGGFQAATRPQQGAFAVHFAVFDRSGVSDWPARPGTRVTWAAADLPLPRTSHVRLHVAGASEGAAAMSIVFGQGDRPRAEGNYHPGHGARLTFPDYGDLVLTHPVRHRTRYQIDATHPILAAMEHGSRIPVWVGFFLRREQPVWVGSIRPQGRGDGEAVTATGRPQRGAREVLQEAPRRDALRRDSPGRPPTTFGHVDATASGPGPAARGAPHGGNAPTQARQLPRPTPGKRAAECQSRGHCSRHYHHWLASAEAARPAAGAHGGGRAGAPGGGGGHAPGPSGRRPVEAAGA